MLATFLVGSANTVLGDDTNFVGAGKWSFNWEEWSAEGALQKEQTAAALGGGLIYKATLGNVDRMLGFRIGRSLGTVGAQAAFLKSVDALVLATGSLVLQPDAVAAPVMTYTNAILKRTALVAGGETTRGMFVTISYKFECQTIS